MKKGFTLVELLVVIGIIGIIMGALITYFAGGTESARAAQCLANMKQLATAVHSAARDSTRYPLAGSVEQVSIGFVSTSRDGGAEVYNERVGWIGWDSQNKYPTSSHIGFTGCSTYNQDEESRMYCLTNGALWRYVRSESSYLCPSHLRNQNVKKTPPKWSYVMNSDFGFDYTHGSKALPDSYDGIEFNSLHRPDKMLLFAELQWEDYIGETPSFTQASGTECDCTLQYDDRDGGEWIGFNHKRNGAVQAHVIFADGHTEKLSYPRDGLTKSELKDLTKWLCRGRDVMYNGRKYDVPSEQRN